jgi:hypothetical protein
LAVVYNHAGSEGRKFMREAHEEQGHTAIDYTQKDSDGASIGTKMQEGIVAQNGAHLGQTNQAAQTTPVAQATPEQSPQTTPASQAAPSESFAAFEAALELPVSAPSNRNVESKNDVRNVSDSGLGTVSDGEFDAIESLFAKMDNFETGPYREGAGLKLEADGLSLSVLRPMENPNFDYVGSLVTGTASPVVGDPNMGIWKRLDNTLTGGIFFNHNSVVDQADMEAYSNTPLFGIDGLTHGDVYDVTTTAAEYLGYAELGLSAGSLKTLRNLDADNAKYAVDDIGSGNPLGIGPIPDRLHYSQLGPRIDGGTGAEKMVFEINGRDDLVVAIQNEPNIGYLQDEVAALSQLDKLGFPVVRNHGVIDIDGTPSLLMERIDGAVSSKAAEYNKLPDLVAALNNQSVKDLQMIRENLINQNINVTDFQFLVRNDGRVFINDPMGISTGVNQADLNMIDHMINLSRSGN